MISEIRFDPDGAAHRLVVTRSHNAKALRLRIDPRDRSIRLSVPRRASLRRAMAWLRQQRPWIETALLATPGGRPIASGLSFHFCGRDIVIEAHVGAPRSPRFSDNVLIVGGPAEFVQDRILRFLRGEARRVLDQETRALASAHGLIVNRIGVGDTRSRWGSCSRSGDIRYSWRLALAPDWVRRAIVAHEVAHRVHMDHGPGFHALARTLYGADLKPASQWLATHGAALHGFGSPV